MLSEQLWSHRVADLFFGGFSPGFSSTSTIYSCNWFGFSRRNISSFSVFLFLDLVNVFAKINTIPRIINPLVIPSRNVSRCDLGLIVIDCQRFILISGFEFRVDLQLKVIVRLSILNHSVCFSELLLIFTELYYLEFSK